MDMMTYQVTPDKMRLEHALIVDYPDQQMHNVNINNIIYIVSTPTCFDASASSSGIFILLLCYRGPGVS
jgi:hypothetical protein